MERCEVTPRNTTTKKNKKTGERWRAGGWLQDEKVGWS